MLVITLSLGPPLLSFHTQHPHILSPVYASYISSGKDWSLPPEPGHEAVPPHPSQGVRLSLPHLISPEPGREASKDTGVLYDHSLSRTGMMVVRRYVPTGSLRDLIYGVRLSLL